MYFAIHCIVASLALTPLVIASPCSPQYPTITPSPSSCSSRTVCADYIKTCTEQGISTQIMYGGCFPDCKPWPTFTAPPCPTKPPVSSCTNSRSICVDNIKTCPGVGTSSILLPYGGCFRDCKPWPTFTPPPCPTPSSSRPSSSSCTNTISVCADYFRTCTLGATSTLIPYGGCFPDCKPWPTFTLPPCPTPTP
ncbi:hypothetical protein Micbo1qcDRAFT_232979 [Microdochium bolleyi]|uniref:Uncharacterized protein n=1 Tax=Microdochium bolleyi TaxID=196109 RepID=A0A136J8J4_9PEZI|nr:hypothetical protein Micbo1qcDRAFT_232979 [Microdochium bolleyi]